MTASQLNPFLLAADNPHALLTVLQRSPELASKQDEHGYSLLHAAASYNNADLLTELVTVFKVDVNVKDEDGETALFVAETVKVARVLVEELGIDTTIKNSEGETAEEKITLEGDFIAVADYLRETRSRSVGEVLEPAGSNSDRPPPLPKGMTLNVGTAAETNEEAGEPDPEFKRRIEELAARDDFQAEEGQQALRDLVKDAISGLGDEGRNVRQRT